MEDEILPFLKNPSVEMKQEHAEALCKVLHDDQDCRSVEEVSKQTEKDCEDVFKKVESKIATKVRLFNAIKNISKKSNISIPERQHFLKKQKQRSYAGFQNKEKSEHCLYDIEGTMYNVKKEIEIFFKKENKQKKLILQAKGSIETFKNNRIEWIDGLNKWKKDCLHCEIITWSCLFHNECTIFNWKNLSISLFDLWMLGWFSFQIYFALFPTTSSILQSISKITDEWKENKQPLQSLGKLSSKILSNSKTMKLPLCRNKPNLIIEHMKGFAKVSNLYKCLKMIPRSEHVLICKETTTEEKVECLLLRTLLCTKKNNKQNARTHCIVSEKLTKEFRANQSELRQMYPYLFVIFSSNRENEIAVTLQQFECKEVIALLHIEDSLYMKE
ncbi:hypothetical protein RFI_16697 [Reticulomyxa filosa]|uniref:Uncharacterized protein n=1 Tax=Reticulomyxa filosa TaxID=46433 RepID=X6N3N7_RETFI|nr:hypothetical protein RFI_16697 [Reticulomyxa filosa]|eukprot:ETO20523.1 hypothetical protein RFI_16697 [Reticulomyxa filosa]